MAVNFSARCSSCGASHPCHLNTADILTAGQPLSLTCPETGEACDGHLPGRLARGRLHSSAWFGRCSGAAMKDDATETPETGRLMDAGRATSRLPTHCFRRLRRFIGAWKSYKELFHDNAKVDLL